nr:hypothetical protein [Hippea maritima]
MKQQWVLYKNSYAKSRGDKTIKKEYQEKEKQETKLIEKLQKRAFFCEADARKAFEEKTKKLECIMISEAKLISKPKYKTVKRNPKLHQYALQKCTIPSLLKTLRIGIEIQKPCFFLLSQPIAFTFNVDDVAVVY